MNEGNITQQLFWAVESHTAICFNQFSLNTSNQDRGKNKRSVGHQIVLFNVLNDDFVAGLIALVPAHLYRGHILFSKRTPGLRLLCFRVMQFM